MIEIFIGECASVMVVTDTAMSYFNSAIFALHVDSLTGRIVSSAG